MTKFLEGKKTYLTGGMLVALGVLTCLGYAEPSGEVVEGVKALLVGAAAMALRAAVAKAE